MSVFLSSLAPCTHEIVRRLIRSERCECGAKCDGMRGGYLATRQEY